MATITFITPDGAEIITEGQAGSVMELAVANNISGIEGDCGGVCSCATCHVQASSEDFSKLGEASEIEQDMLEFADGATEYSRLCCQIQISEGLEGIQLKVIPSF